MMDFQNKTKVGGEYIKAFLAAYEAFRNDPDIATEKKKVENYSLEFSENKDRYFVLFFAKRLPSEMTLKGGETQLGRDVRYIVDKTDYRVVAREFFK